LKSFENHFYRFVYSSNQMNIFVLDRNIRTSAPYHCDQHGYKMILESVKIIWIDLKKKIAKALDKFILLG